MFAEGYRSLVRDFQDTFAAAIKNSGEHYYRASTPKNLPLSVADTSFITILNVPKD
jgi:hypothetical protein